MHKRFQIIFFLSLMGCLLVACKKDKDRTIEEGDYLIFGHYYGFCAGEECIEIFKLTADKLYEDTNDEYPAGGSFNFELLEADKFDLIGDLENDIPAELLTSPDSTFGCPDCMDQGGIFVRFMNDGIQHEWRIDQLKADLPEYLHEFVDLINEKIDLISS